MRDPQDEITYRALIRITVKLCDEEFIKDMSVNFSVPGGFVISRYELESMADKAFSEEYEKLINECDGEYDVISVNRIL